MASVVCQRPNSSSVVAAVDHQRLRQVVVVHYQPVARVVLLDQTRRSLWGSWVLQGGLLPPPLPGGWGQTNANKLAKLE